MLFRFLVLSFGFMFALRIIQFQILRKPLSEAISKKMVRLQILFFWMLTILSPWISVPVLCFLLFVPNLAAHRLDQILNLILRHQFRQKLIQFVDELILLMMTGKSFRDSFLQITTESQTFFSMKMRELILTNNFPGQTRTAINSDLQTVAEFVHSIDKNPHKALDKLRAFRRQLHWSILFKKKSRQATVQIRAQATILSALYGGLLFFVFNEHGMKVNSVIFPSLFLYFSGLITLFLIGRRQKWKT